MKLGSREPTLNRPVPPDDVLLLRLQRRLRRYGVPEKVARATVDDLRGDLPAAGSLSELIGDPETFAKTVARDNGRAPVPARHWIIVPAMAIPMVVIAFLTYAFIIGGGPALGLEYRSLTFTANETITTSDGTRTVHVESALDEWKPLIVYALATILGVGASFGVTALCLGVVRDTRVGATVGRIFVTLPVGGLTGVVAAIFIGASTNYSDSPRVIAVEAFTVFIFGAASIVVARAWARRVPAKARRAQPHPHLV